MGSGDQITLYELAAADPNVRFSPHCWKTRFALAHKGLSAHRIPWRFTEKDVISFSGQERVPVLTHGGTTVSDSWRIALYLEQTYPSRPSLFGAPNAVPVTRFVNTWADTVLMPTLARVILLDIFACIDPRDRAYFRQSREARFGMPLEQVGAGRDAHLRDFRNGLFPLRQLLEQQDFLGGAAPTYADYCVFGMFMWAHCVSAVGLLEDGDPVAAWRERLFEACGGLGKQAPRAVAAKEGITA